MEVTIKRKSDIIISSCDTSFITQYPSLVIGRINGSLEFWTYNGYESKDIFCEKRISSQGYKEFVSNGYEHENIELNGLSCVATWDNPETHITPDSNFEIDGKYKKNDTIIVDGIIGICALSSSETFCTYGESKELNEEINVIVATRQGIIIWFQILLKNNVKMESQTLENQELRNKFTQKMWKWSQICWVSSQQGKWIFICPPERIKLKPDDKNDDSSTNKDNLDAIFVPLQSGFSIIVQPRNPCSASNDTLTSPYLKVIFVKPYQHAIRKITTKDTTFNNTDSKGIILGKVSKVINCVPLYGTFDSRGRPLICLIVSLNLEDKNDNFYHVNPYDHDLGIDACKGHTLCCFVLQYHGIATLDTLDRQKVACFTLEEGPWCVEFIPTQSYVLSSHDLIRSDIIYSKLVNSCRCPNLKPQFKLSSLRRIQKIHQYSGILLITPYDVQFLSHSHGVLLTKGFFPSCNHPNLKGDSKAILKSVCIIPPSHFSEKGTDLHRNIHQIFPLESAAALVWIEEKFSRTYSCFHIFRVSLIWYKEKAGIEIESEQFSNKRSINAQINTVCSIEVIPIFMNEINNLDLVAEKRHDQNSNCKYWNEYHLWQNQIKPFFKGLTKGSTCVTCNDFFLSGSYLIAMSHRNRNHTKFILMGDKRKRISFCHTYSHPIQEATFTLSNHTAALPSMMTDGQLAIISGSYQDSTLSIINKGFLTSCATLYAHSLHDDIGIYGGSVDIGLGNSSFFRSPMICLAPTPPQLTHGNFDYVFDDFCSLFFFSNNADKTLVMRCKQTHEIRCDNEIYANIGPIFNSPTIPKLTDLQYELEPLHDPIYALGIEDSYPSLAVCTVLVKSTITSQNVLNKQSSVSPMTYTRLLLHANKLEIRCCMTPLCLSNMSIEDDVSIENKAICLASYNPPNGIFINNILFSEDDINQSCSESERTFDFDYDFVYCLLCCSDNSLRLLRLEKKEKNGVQDDLSPLLTFKPLLCSNKSKEPSLQYNLFSACSTSTSSMTSIAMYTVKKGKPRAKPPPQNIRYYDLYIAVAIVDNAAINFYGVAKKEQSDNEVIIDLLLIVHTCTYISYRKGMEIKSLQFLPDDSSGIDHHYCKFSNLSLAMGFSDGLIVVASKLIPDNNKIMYHEHQNEETEKIISQPTIKFYQYQLGIMAVKFSRVFIQPSSGLYGKNEKESSDQNDDFKKSNYSPQKNGFWLLIASSSQRLQSQPAGVIIGFAKDLLMKCREHQQMIDDPFESRESFGITFYPLSIDNVKSETQNRPHQSKHGNCNEERSASLLFDEINTSFLSLIPNYTVEGGIISCCWMACSGKSLKFGSIHALQQSFHADVNSLVSEPFILKHDSTPTHLHFIELFPPKYNHRFSTEQSFLLLVSFENSEGSRLVLYNPKYDLACKQHPECPSLEMKQWQPLWISDNISHNKVITCITSCPRDNLRSKNFNNDSEIRSFLSSFNYANDSDDLEKPCIAISMIEFPDNASRHYYEHNHLSIGAKTVKSSVIVMQLASFSEIQNEVGSIVDLRVCISIHHVCYIPKIRMELL